MSAFLTALGGAAMANPIGAIGAGLGAIGLFKKNKPAKPVYTDLTKIVANAREAGIHPLEVIRSGAGVAGVQGPRINSFTAAAGAFDQVSDFLTGTQAAADDQRMFEAQLANINADTARMGRIGTSATSGSRSFSTAGPDENRVDKRVSNVEEIFQVDGGDDVTVPVGPDLDEIVSGAAIRAIGHARNPNNFFNRDLNNPTLSQRNAEWMVGNSWRLSNTVAPRIPFRDLPDWQQAQADAFRSDLEGK